MPQATVGVTASPTAGTVLADTGALAIATLSPTVMITTQYASRVTLALRNATNDADLWSHLIKTSSDAPVFLTSVGSIAFGLNQRLVVRAESAVDDGDAASSLVSESNRPGPPKKIDAFPQNESLAPLTTTL